MKYLPGIIGATLAVVVCVIAGKAFDLSPVDDAYITYRHANNYAADKGLVYNPGERVEATSNFLFAAILGISCRLGVDPRDSSLILNIISWWMISFFIVWDVQRRLEGCGAHINTIFVGLVSLIISPSIIYYSWSGLETMFYTALLFSGGVVFIGGNSRGTGYVLAGLLWGLAASTRLEAVLAILAAVLTLASVDRSSLGPRDTIKGALSLILSFIAVAAPVLLWRLHYYGDCLPNTYYAKVYGGGLEMWRRGIRYSVLFLFTYVFFFLALLKAAWILFVERGVDRRRAFILLTFLLHTIYVCRVGGDYFPFYRFMIPMMPLLALLCADLIRRTRGQGWSLPRKHWMIIVALAVANSVTPMLNINDLATARWLQREVEKRAHVGRLLKENVPRDATLLLGAAGAIPYHSMLTAHDFYGLSDPVLARRVMAIGEGLAGHEKTDLFEQVNRLVPDIILFRAWKNEVVPESGIRRLKKTLLSYYEKANREQRSIVEHYQMMELRGEHHIALCAVKKRMVDKLGAGFQPLENLVGLPLPDM